MDSAGIALEGIEFLNEDPNRQTGSDCSFRPHAIYNKRSSNVFVNLIIHDVGVGIYNEDTTSGVKIADNVIFNNGWQGPTRGHGHALYLKSSAGMIVRGNVMFNNFGYGLHVYTDPGQNINNITLLRNVAFNNGTLATISSSSNILVGGAQASTGNLVDSNMTYFSSPEIGSMGENVIIGYQSTLNNSITVRNNYFVGKGSGDNPVLKMGYWQNSYGEHQHIRRMQAERRLCRSPRLSCSMPSERKLFVEQQCSAS